MQLIPEERFPLAEDLLKRTAWLPRVYAPARSSLSTVIRESQLL